METHRILGGQLIVGDATEGLRELADDSVHCCITSPPYYGHRDYAATGQLGQEASLAEYVESIVGIMAEVHRVLHPSGTLWLNIGDSYAGSRKGRMPDGSAHPNSQEARPKRVQQSEDKGAGKIHTVATDRPAKSVLGVPWKVAFGLQDAGWILRADIVWTKPNGRPERVKDRPTKTHEFVFMLTKKAYYNYYPDGFKEPVQAASLTRAKYGLNTNSLSMSPRPISVKQMGKRFVNPDGRNARSVWSINTHNSGTLHPAVFPPELVRRAMLLGCPKDGVVLDPFIGSGTVALVAEELGRRWVGIELNPAYASLVHKRLGIQPTLF